MPGSPIFPKILETYMCQNRGTWNEHFPNEHSIPPTGMESFEMRVYKKNRVNVIVSYATKFLVQTYRTIEKTPCNKCFGRLINKLINKILIYFEK